MAYIFPDAEQLEGKPVVDDGFGNYVGQCVSLVKRYSRAPATSSWRQGAPVRGNHNLKVGTAIATFIDGRYPSNSTGNHAAFYCGQDASGIWVIEQYRTLQKIKKRKLPFEGTGGQDRVNNGDAYSVIE